MNVLEILENKNNVMRKLTVMKCFVFDSLIENRR
jgi:hypothetical protein